MRRGIGRVGHGGTATETLCAAPGFFLLTLSCSLSPASAAAGAADSLYDVAKISVDITAENAVAARRRVWPKRRGAPSKPCCSACCRSAR